MRLLLDHNIPLQLRRLLSGHDVSAARDMGWDTIVNGDLLARAEAAGFQCLLTGDRNLAYQQNLTSRKIAIVVVNVIDRIALTGQVTKVVEALQRAREGAFIEVMLELPPLRRRPFPSSDT